MKRPVLVGFSGGIDSLAAARLLREAGFEVHLLALDLVPGNRGSFHTRVCYAARLIDMPVFFRDLTEDFTARVVKPTRETYAAGRTPNPCAWCNERIKFVGLAAAADELGIDNIATGHYCRRGAWPGAGGGPVPVRGVDEAKEQSYFLALVPLALVSRCLFPLGELTKESVRGIVRQLGMALESYCESRELCFAADAFPAGSSAAGAGEVKATAGDIVDRAGRVLGHHDGVHRFTVGQRRGLGIAHSEPLYVYAVKPAERLVVVAERRELYRREFIVETCNWFVDPAVLPAGLFCQVRYRHRAAPARVRPLDGGRAAVVFAAPQFAVTPGQTAAFYDGSFLLGGGSIL
ncbi:MAG: tRNA 2-thiouridine(34) synthase MnmA [Deltaproteobacteria bacterium]|nr:tRNA 2-thiouridine(34) synthase MnmA [Candidatus Anaeroferrophillacea bacterium]